MTTEVLTITFPATKTRLIAGKPTRVPCTERVQWTGELKRYNQLQDGQLFLLDDKVYERQDGQLAACLLPWDNSDYRDFLPSKIVGVLKSLNHPFQP